MHNHPGLHNFDDPRPIIERLRRTELREICRKKGITLPAVMPPATVMRALIEAEGGIEAVMAKPDQPLHKIQNEQATSEDVDNIRAALESKPMPEIRKLCKAHGIVQHPRDKKPTLIERLLDHAG